MRDAVNAIVLPESIAETLNSLDLAKGKVEAYTDVYGDDEQGRPRGVVFFTQSGINRRTEAEDTSPQLYPPRTTSPALCQAPNSHSKSTAPM